jgi:hypothetical protein
MKKVRNVFKRVLLVIIAVFVLSVMLPNVASNGNSINSVDAATIKLSATKMTMVTGESKTLKLSGSKKTPNWSSSKKKVATVSSKGKVTAKSKGTAVITAKIGSKKYTCKVTVQNPQINKTSLSLNVGKTYQLKISGDKQKTKWSSSKTSVATVSSNGKVTAKSAGTTKITAKVGSKKYYCTVTVVNSTNQKKLAFQKLKNYILTYGSENQAGNMFLKTSGYDSSYNLWSWCIIYDSGKNIIDFMVARDAADSDDSTYCQLYFDKDMNAHLKCEFSEYQTYYGSIDYVEAIAYINPATYTTNTTLEFQVNSNEIYVSDSSIQTLGNAILEVGFSEWTELLRPTGVTFKDLGFEKL